MDAPMFWAEQPRACVAVCRFHTVRELAAEPDPNLVKAATWRSTILSGIRAERRSWSATPCRWLTSRFSPIPGVAHEGGFHLDGYAAVRSLDRRCRAIARPAAGALNLFQEHPWPQLHPSTFVAPAVTTSASSSTCWLTTALAARTDRGSDAGVVLQGTDARSRSEHPACGRRG